MLVSSQVAFVQSSHFWYYFSSRRRQDFILVYVCTDFNSNHSELRLGGLSIAKVFSKAAACEQAYAESELWG